MFLFESEISIVEISQKVVGTKSAIYFDNSLLFISQPEMFCKASKQIIRSTALLLNENVKNI